MTEDRKSAEKRRLAAALRANLQRRKIAGTRRGSTAPHEPADPAAADGTPAEDGDNRG